MLIVLAKVVHSTTGHGSGAPREICPKKHSLLGYLPWSHDSNNLLGLAPKFAKPDCQHIL